MSYRITAAKEHLRAPCPSMADAIVLSDAGCDADAASRVFHCLTQGLSFATFNTVCKSAVPIHLAPCTSDFSSAPEKSDVEQHFGLLSVFMKAFPEKAPSLSTMVAGICAADDFYRKALSKATTKKRQQAWAAVDAHTIRQSVWSLQDGP